MNDILKNKVLEKTLEEIKNKTSIKILQYASKNLFDEKDTVYFIFYQLMTKITSNG